MAKIVMVHGMNMQSLDHDQLKDQWYPALLKLLRSTDWGKTHEQDLPKSEDVEIAYWADLMSWPNFDEEAMKGIGSDAVNLWYALCRAGVHLADKASWFGKDGRPNFGWAEVFDRWVAQTAIYMANGAVYHPNPEVGDGAFFQVQARFQAALSTDTRLVIGHSLGTVVAYEGLYSKPNTVPSFITIGSPLASPDLILKPLRQRAARLVSGKPNDPLPWPRSLKRWTNFYAGADVWAVPVQGLSQVIEDVIDVRVEHGSFLHGPSTHALPAYLQHIEIGNAIADALRT